MSTSFNPVVDNNPPSNEPVDPPEGAEQSTDSDKPETVAIPPEIQYKLDSFERQLKEERANVKYWRERDEARLKTERTPPAPPAAPQPTEPDLDPEEFIGAVTKGDFKALKGMFAKLGMVDREEVERQKQELTERFERQQEASMKIAQLTAKYPDLAKTDSPLFQRSLQIMEELGSDPALANSPRRLDFAVQQARLEILEQAATNPPPAPPEPDHSAERERRIGAQAGAAPRKREARTVATPLTPQQQEIAKKWGMSEDEYRANQKRVFAP